MSFPLYRHKKTEVLYRVVNKGIIQSSGLRELDNVKAVMYQKADDTFAPIWVRPEEEFMDGRFEVVE